MGVFGIFGNQSSFLRRCAWAIARPVRGAGYAASYEPAAGRIARGPPAAYHAESSYGDDVGRNVTKNAHRAPL